MNHVVCGLVLRSTDYKESDKILTVLTDGLGKVTVRARGARRRGSRLLAGCQLFAYSEMTLFEQRGRYTLDEAELIEGFSGLQRRLERVSLASYFVEVLDAEGEGDARSGEVLRLALNSIFSLSAGLQPLEKVKAVFELRYMALSGYAPRLACCAVCGAEPQRPMLSPASGLLHCAGCVPPSAGRSWPLDPASLAAMRYVLGADSRKLFAFTIAEPSASLFYNACEAYLLSRAERRFRTLDFYKSAGETP